MARSPRDIWAKRIERQAKSGLTVKEFCAKHDCNPHTFAGWKWRLGREAKSAKKSRKRRSASTPLSFIELPSTPLMIEVALGRWTVRVPSSFDDDALRRVLELLEERS